MDSIERSPPADPVSLPLDERARTMSRLLVDRFSCRSFSPDPVPADMLEHLLAMAQMAPSWCNVQPWRVTLTSGGATERLRAALLADLDSLKSGGAPDVPFPISYAPDESERRREVGWQLYDSVGVKRGDRDGSLRQASENQRLFGAPHALLIHMNRDLGAYGLLDCGTYLGTLLLAAQSLGLAIIAQASLALHAPVIRQLFGIPDNQMMVVGASLGFPNLEHPANTFRSRRSPVSASVRMIAD